MSNTGSKQQKKINTIGSDKLDQCICELTNTYLLLVDSSFLYSSLAFMPCIQTVLESYESLLYQTYPRVTRIPS